MFEILFRGFTPAENGKDKVFVNGEWIKGEWVQGSYLKLDKTTYCFKEDYEATPDNTEHYIVYDKMTDWGLPNIHVHAKVIPETVGQCIGLTDKKGRKIFKGDVLKSVWDEDYPEDFSHEVVLWYENGWCIKQGKATPDRLDGAYKNNCLEYSEVAGNVWDHPELLEEGVE